MSTALHLVLDYRSYTAGRCCFHIKTKKVRSLRHTFSHQFDILYEALPALADALSSLLIPYSSLPDREHRVAQYSPRYRLAFSLLNEDPSAGNVILNWDVKTAIHRESCILYAFTGFMEVI